MGYRPQKRFHITSGFRFNEQTGKWQFDAEGSTLRPDGEKSRAFVKVPLPGKPSLLQRERIERHWLRNLEAELSRYEQGDTSMSPDAIRIG